MNLLEVLEELKQSQYKLKLILNSISQGIYGMDINGVCTFCNKSGLKILGYTSEEQVIGKDIHMMIHHSKKDGTPISPEECKILSALKKEEEMHIDDEIFWRADGTFFDVEYFSYPEFINEKLSGVVVIFRDITSRKKEERDILYNAYHDSLTGLYNRRYMDEEIDKLDIESSLPLSIIVGDINGLKQMNDIFGHRSGDMLIQQVAQIIKNNSRSEDVCVRMGGDEFLIVLPKTSSEEANNIARSINKQVSILKIQSFHSSISLGVSTKTSMKEKIIHTIDIADTKMYNLKTVDRVNFNDSSIDAIMNRLHEVCIREEEHSYRVKKLCEKIGRSMGLTISEMRRLTDAAYYHDIGKIILDPKVLNKKKPLSELELQIVRRHPVVGYKILSLSDKTMDIARYVLDHHERWDGQGYPNHLKGENIPRISRILALADCYELMLHGTNYKKAIGKEEAIQDIERNAGTQFDPQIVNHFIKIVENEELSQ